MFKTDMLNSKVFHWEILVVLLVMLIILK